MGVSVFIVIIFGWCSTPFPLHCPGFHDYFWYPPSGFAVVWVHVHEFEQVRMWTLLRSRNYVCSGLALSASPDV